jgi:uncharacterized protein YceH (UPF0502 family)
VLAVLMLRAAQTPGELRTRTERLHHFADAADLAATMQRLMERGLVARLDRRPGQREERYRHLLSEDVPPEPEEAIPRVDEDDPEARLRRIEQQIAELRSQVEALRAELGA